MNGQIVWNDRMGECDEARIDDDFRFLDFYQSDTVTFPESSYWDPEETRTGVGEVRPYFERTYEPSNFKFSFHKNFDYIRDVKFMTVRNALGTSITKFKFYVGKTIFNLI